jgi:hypothetical protein
MKSLSLAIIAAALSTSALAAQPGQWNKSVALDGQTLHYGVTDDKGNSLDIQCGKEPATMHVSLNQRYYGPGYPQDFSMQIGSKKLFPSDAGSNAGGDNFRAAWDALRAGKKVIVHAGKASMVVPVAGAAAVLPANPLRRSARAGKPAPVSFPKQIAISTEVAIFIVLNESEA